MTFPVQGRRGVMAFSSVAPASENYTFFPTLLIFISICYSMQSSGFPF